MVHNIRQMTNEWQFLTTAIIIKLGKNIVGRKMGIVTLPLITPRIKKQCIIPSYGFH